MSKKRTASQPPRDGKNERGLTPRQERFVQEYLISLNATDAAEKAGYSQCHVQGPRLLANVSVLRAIQESQEERATRVQVDQDYVLQGLIEIKERCMQAEPVRDMRGRIIEGMYCFDGKNANKALELLGRHLGMFVDRKEHSGPGGGPIPLANLSQLTDEELHARRKAILDKQR